MTAITSKIQILLVDDHALFRESVARLLAAETDFEVVGNVGTVEEASAVLQNLAIDLVLLDFDLGHRDGVDFMRLAKSIGFAGKIMLVTAGVDEAVASGMIQQGLAGIFVKHNSPSLLIHAIREVASGNVWFDRDYLSRVVGKTEANGTTPIRRFTARERQVLALVFEGLANKQIADRLDISEASVKAALQQLFAKTGVRTRSQLVRIALEQYRDQL